ncbi:restriction endonuclease subunit S [Planktotalea arctica]|uniref:restriction endonuclease subunit S n=1 Tax=Planktotalea arctica TaxID=1481893 RepID=UPI00321AF69D
MLDQLSRYDSYRDTGFPWIGDVPSDWASLPLIALATPRKISGHPKYELLSVYLDKGVIRFSDVDEKRTNTTSEDLSNYQVVEPGDFVLNNQQAWRGSVGVSVHQGLVSPAYIVLKLSEQLDPQYANYLFRDQSMVAHYLISSKGVGTIQRNLYWPKLKRVPVFFPDLDTQNRIVKFLDEKTAEIDAAVVKKRRLIDLLNEQKAILINRAVTKGLNPDTPMKDSGVDWIGEIPAHWDVKRAKYVFDEIDHRSATGEEELLSVSHTTGVTPRSEKNIMMFMAEDYTGSKLCQPGDVVFNIMWAWMGALGVSEHDGIVSPSYGVFRSKEPDTFNNWYLEHLLRSWGYVQEYNRVSTGLHSSRLRLYAHMFLAMEVGFPAHAEQDEIERETKDRLELFDQSIDATQREISTLNEFKQTLIANAVTGKIKI